MQEVKSWLDFFLSLWSKSFFCTFIKKTQTFKCTFLDHAYIYFFDAHAFIYFFLSPPVQPIFLGLVELWGLASFHVSRAGFCPLKALNPFYKYPAASRSRAPPLYVTCRGVMKCVSRSNAVCLIYISWIKPFHFCSLCAARWLTLHHDYK